MIMTSNKTGLIVLSVAAVIVLAVTFFIGRASVSDPMIAGAIGTNPVENYIPIIKYNEGYYSELPVQTTSTLTAGGATTLSSTLAVTGAATLSSTLTAAGTTTVSNALLFATASSTPQSSVANAIIDDTGAATSTIWLTSRHGTRGGCIQFETPASTTLRAYATTTGPLILESGSCR